MQRVIELVDAIIKEDTHTLGEPWHAKGSLAAVVPIMLRQPPAFDRGYVTAEEVLEKLDIKDTGSIDELELQTSAGVPVFVRSGMLFKGQGTQSRAAVESAVYNPGKKGRVRARCVYASHGIRTGAKFKAAGFRAPLRSSRTLYSARSNQSETWDSVGETTALLASVTSASFGFGGATHRAGSSRSDDLIGSIEDSGYADMMNKFIKEMPPLENQVGIAVLDADGVAGVEVFDHPDSWKAVATSVLQTYGESFMQKAKSAFILDTTRAKSSVMDFLTSIREAIGKSSGADGSYKFTSDAVEGEYSNFKQRTIHVIAIRTEQREAPRPHVRTISMGLSGIGSITSSTSNVRYELPATSTYGPTQVFTAQPLGHRRKVLLTMDEATVKDINHYAETHTGGNRSAAVERIVKQKFTRRGKRAPAV